MTVLLHRETLARSMRNAARNVSSITQDLEKAEEALKTAKGEDRDKLLLQQKALRLFLAPHD